MRQHQLVPNTFCLSDNLGVKVEHRGSSWQEIRFFFFFFFRFALLCLETCKNWPLWACSSAWPESAGAGGHALLLSIVLTIIPAPSLSYRLAQLGVGGAFSF